jgi:hypothetical protein
VDLRRGHQLMSEQACQHRLWQLCQHPVRCASRMN